jgi:DNA-binding MarR family transcriptional regulator
LRLAVFLFILTEKGIIEAEEITKVFQRFDELVCDDIDEDEINIFYKVLAKMCANLESYKNPGG